MHMKKKPLQQQKKNKGESCMRGIRMECNGVTKNTSTNNKGEL